MNPPAGRRRWRLAALLALAAVPAAGAAAAAGAVGVEAGGLSGGRFVVAGIESLAARRFRTVVRQDHDLSCGAAAVAGLLTHHYRRPTAERAVVTAMLAAGDPRRIAAHGFSLLDMKRYLAGRGLTAEGYRVTLAQLAAAGLPAITLVDHGGWRHFVLIKGVSDAEVLVGDPAAGLRVHSVAAFTAIWTGIALVIGDESEAAAATFNRPAEWALRLRAPVAAALGPSLGADTLAAVSRLAAPFTRF